MLDKLLALLAFSAFAGFLGVIIFSVAHPILILVASIGIAFVAYDFVDQIFIRPRRSG